jgi:hypothetical protein
MPTVRLHGRCSRPGDLPDVCAKCGAEARHHVTRTFKWYPPWIIVTILAGLLVYLILALVLQKSYKVAVPMCQDHKGHWVNRILITVAGFFVLFGGGIALAVLMGVLSDSAAPQDRDVYGIVALISVVGGIVGWLVLIVVANMTAIRPTEITDDSIKLTNVSQAFAEAYEDQEDREREARRASLDRFDERRPRRDWDDDDRPRRRDDRRIQAEDEEDDRPRRPRREREDEY